MTECVKVMVRCRPMSQQQIERGCKSIIEVDKVIHQIGLKKISSVNTTIKHFAFDHVFDQEASQQQVYQQSSFSLVESVLDGYNGTIFAYGQTGCGKTHTMLGVTTTLLTKKSHSTNNKQNLAVTVTSLTLQDQTMGIIPRAFRQIITVTKSQTNKNHLIHCTFIEIYNEEIHDLLGKDLKAKINLQQTPAGLVMKDLSLHLAKNVSDMQRLMEIGYKNRVIRQTSMNKQSSRSHCIFTIRIEESELNQNGVQKFKIGKLNLVDLAGSERQSKTNLKGQGVKETSKINLSLSALGNVISALVDGKKQHIPYRDSKLTRILNDSLGGNTRTVMIATISPADYNYEETLSTLRYSSRAKFIQNKPVVNEDPKDALLRKYEEQIRRLKLILEGKLPYVRGNDTFYVNSQSKELNIFAKFPELQNQQNEAILNQINPLDPIESLISSQKVTSIDMEDRNQNNDPDEKNRQQDEQRTLLNIEKKQIIKQLNFLSELTKKETNTSPELFEQLQKINEFKQKLKQQAQKQQKYKQQEKKREQQLLSIQKSYKNLNDQVDSIKQKFQQLKIKYIQTSQELKDAREAHEKEKQDILQALRIQEAQNNKLMEILNVIVLTQQLQKLFEKCQWVEDKQRWIVPKFQFSQKLGVIIQNTENDKSFIISEKKITKQLQRLQKTSKTMVQTKLMIEQQVKRNLNRRISQSQKKLSYQSDQKPKVERSQSHRQNPKDVNHKDVNPKDVNLFLSEEGKIGFKNSCYSDSNQQRRSQMRGVNITNKSGQKRVLQRHKLSLEPLPRLRGESQGRVGLDLQQIKRQIMSEMKQKNKMGSSSRKY